MRPLNILVVDDELALRQITADTIARHGHTVETAGGGNEALEKLKVGEFDICLSDIRMPDLSGLELIERAKALKIETSFLMMTAYASVTTAIEAMKLGAYDYLVKPFDVPKLKEIVANALKAARDMRQVVSYQPLLETALADTVGFVRDLPHELVAAFRSTLQEAREADLLLHVIDASDVVLGRLTESLSEPVVGDRALLVIEVEDRRAVLVALVRTLAIALSGIAN